jgi:hypothetical protein
MNILMIGAFAVRAQQYHAIDTEPQAVRHEGAAGQRMT